MDPNPPGGSSDQCRDMLDFNIDNINFNELPDIDFLLSEDDFFQVNDIGNFSSQHRSDISNTGLELNDQDSDHISMREPATENQSIGTLSVGELGLWNNVEEFTDEILVDPALASEQGGLEMDLIADQLTADESLGPSNMGAMMSFGEMPSSPDFLSHATGASLPDTSPGLTSSSAQSSMSDDSFGFPNSQDTPFFNGLFMPTLPVPAIPPFPENNNQPRQYRNQRKKKNRADLMYVYPSCGADLTRLKPGSHRSQIRKRDKPERCEVCKIYGAATPRDLRRHYKTNHPAEAKRRRIVMSKFKCPDCSKEIGRKDNLDRHRRKSCKGKGNV